MSARLRILHLEDDPDYSRLVEDLLEQGGVSATVKMVTTQAEFDTALAQEQFDLILADYSLPQWNGIQALGIAREKAPQTPFLLVSGTIGEQIAIDSLQAGATDYVLKQWPDRLVPAVRRAVGEAEERARRKRAETELIRREKYFRALTRNSLDIVAVLSRDGMYQYHSPSLLRVLGYDPEELEGKSVFPFVHPDDLSRVREAFQYGLEHPNQAVTLEYRFRHKDGHWVYLEAVGQNRLDDPDISAIVVNSRDVSERKRVEAQRDALSNLGRSLSSITVPEEAARIIQAVAEELFGWDVFMLDLYSAEKDEILPILDVDTIDGKRVEFRPGSPTHKPSDLARGVIEHGAKLILREQPTAMLSEAVPFGDTTRPSVSLMLAPVRNRTKVIGVLSIHSYNPHAYTQRDLDTFQVLADYCGGALERIRAERAYRESESALRSSELLFHAVWENSVDGMRLTDETGTIVAVNNAFCKLAGLSQRELEGKPFTVIAAASEKPELILSNYRNRFRGRVIERQIERRQTLHNGNAVIFEETSSFVELRGQPPLLLGLFRDVTNQKRLEEQLRQAQKMDAIGQLAGGVAHDFNNILTVIHGHATLLQLGGNLTEAPAKSAQQIIFAAERAAGLTRQLLTFSRRQVMQARRLDMNEIVANMTKMLGRILGEDITLQVDYWSQPPCVQADSSMMEQVVLNLAVNARDAMPRGGQLTITIAVADVGATHVAYNPEARQGRFIRLTATDTGIGITPEIMRRIFEPFFSTKEVGKGTGLGLATVYGVVKQHQGWVEVQSEPGRGASFRVYIPQAESESEKGDLKTSVFAVRGGTETILVVEDERPVRELVCNLLQNRGYRVLEAESGAKALETWAAHKDQINLVITDLVMPDRINGRELAEKLWQERPDLKVIFTSGYSADVVGKEFVLHPGLNYLQKPYHPNTLALAVRDCLDANGKTTKPGN